MELMIYSKHQHFIMATPYYGWHSKIQKIEMIVGKKLNNCYIKDIELDKTPIAPFII
jgi:hypothetical protein